MLKVLLIDDNPDIRTLVIRFLKREFIDLEVKHVIDAPSFAQALTLNNFDIGIIDYQLCWSDGLTILSELKGTFPELPVVMFTNSATQEVAIEAMKAGLDDYVVKSSNHYIRLVAAVKNALEGADYKQKSACLEIRLQSLLNRLNVGVFRSTLAGKLLEANSTFLDILGVENISQAQSLNLHDFFSPLPERRQLLEELQQQGHIYGQETQLQQVNGNMIWVRWNKIITQEGQEMFVDGLVENISDVYDELRLRKQLENAQQQTTIQLAQVNRLKDEFLTTLSHELRTPLNAILGWSNILRTKLVDTGTLARGVDAIFRNAKQQLHLVEDLLDTSRIIKGNLKLNIRNIDLRTVISSTIEVINPAIEAKNINIDVKFDSNIDFIFGDSDRLQQIVWNLLSNAIKFTPYGGRIQVNLSRVEITNKEKKGLFLCPTKYAQLKISDNGMGINKDFLPHIFDRFMQADGSSTRSYGGLGLGLAIVRYLVELHGGKVWAESLGEKQGATFIVQIPLISKQKFADRSTLINPIIANQGIIENTSILQGLRILVVDDEADSRDLLTSILTIYGANVITVSSVAEAIETLNSFIPNVLLSDIYMPEVDGYHLIQQIRRLNNDLSKIPAIAISAYTHEVEEKKILNSGFQVYMPKPFVPDALVGTIAKLTGRE
ncbi:response regulator [Brunnivagina elsteri]|uniref:Circadian input-output histidine kinase CikA n=1 Tax=Brunnivagina elsteri CCALA 953 TaxID=987040 RepID=A0A2A2TG46_9CYAN|nr:response regulator [Calothrix elsteri]PAX52615.1 hybrid sensor histidine kinase/response regulator [Calothrix elsteri CCALA 953]